MSSPTQKKSKGYKIQTDVRNVVFFIFFALTIGAASGLFSYTKEAVNSDSISAKSQLSTPVLADLSNGSGPPYSITVPGLNKPYESIINDRVAVLIDDNNALMYVSESGTFLVTNIQTGKSREVSGQELDNIEEIINQRDGHTSETKPTQQVDTNNADTRCSTTYVVLDTINASKKTVGCYGTKPDKAHIAVENLAKCIANNTHGATTPDAIASVYNKTLPVIKNGMCKGPKAIRVKSSSNANAVLNKTPLIIYPISTPNIPTACQAQYNDIIRLMGGINTGKAPFKTAPSATAKDAQECSWKGAVVCYQKDANDTESLVCKRKSEVAVDTITGDTDTPKIIQKVPIATPTSTYSPAPAQAQTASCKGFMCFINSLLRDSGIQKSVGKFISRFLTGSKNGCPQGYIPSGVSTTGSTTNTTCTPEPVTPQPQCAMASSKSSISSGESILLRWRTADADTVSIAGVGTSVNKDGEETLLPQVTTTYKLTAKNAEKEKVCTTTVVVDGQVSGATGAYPPQLSCSPSAIQPQETAKVTWTCSGGADRSSGIGVNTNDSVTGSASVIPTHTQNYSVKCFKNDKEIGANTCSVTVGNPQYDIIAYPTSVGKGERVRISWASLFMDNCSVKGPRGFDYEHTEGSVITKPFDEQSSVVPNDAVYTLECLSQFGTTVVRDVSVGFSE